MSSTRVPAPEQPRQALPPRLLLVLAVVLVLLGGTAVGVAHFAGRSSASSLDRAQGLVAADKAPSLPALDASDWINTPPLSAASLRGKVVLVDFWTASCINCRRTFPYLRALQSTYAAHGLVVLGVHTPEFGFEHSAAYVARSAKELGVTWPVANDPDMTIWDEFGNQYWPAQYLVDRTGKVRLAHAGEGDDDLLEADVRALLDEGGSAGSAHVGDVRTSEVPGSGGVKQTPESYVGAERGGNSLPQGVVAVGTTVTRHDPAPELNAIALDGSFTGSADHVTAAPGATVTLRYEARDAYVVLAPHGAPTADVAVTLDGEPLDAADRGPSVATGGSSVHVTENDLFHVVTGPTGTDPVHTLTLRAGSAAVDVYSFTFGA